MVVNMRKHYIYAHYTLDTDECFHIGVGTHNNKRKYDRAHSTSGRNNYYVNIVNKHGLRVEIIKDGYSNRDKAVDDEVMLQLLIKPRACLVYGDRQLALYKPMSQETKDKVSKAKKGKKLSPEQVKNMKGRTPWNKGQKLPEQSEARKGSGNPMYGKKQTAKYYEGRKKMLGGGNPAAREVIDTETGIIYSSIKEAAEQFNLNVNTLRGYLSNYRPNKTNLTYKDQYNV
jgi:hypothetical protein